jgi:ATP phosphoribosyltransferase regulatory subunit HisZ
LLKKKIEGKKEVSLSKESRDRLKRALSQKNKIALRQVTNSKSRSPSLHKRTEVTMDSGSLGKKTQSSSKLDTLLQAYQPVIVN